MSSTSSAADIEWTGPAVLRRAGARHRRRLAAGSTLIAAHQLCEVSVPVMIGVIVDRAVATGSVSAILIWTAALAALFVVLTLVYRLGARLLDSLWVRIIDVGRALEARRYVTDVDVVLDVTDAQLPRNTGRWRLTVTPGRVTCRPTDEPADLACTSLELGAVYLGGPTLSALAAAGRVRELTPGALFSASTAFGWHRKPSAIEVF